jgi:hypothetical protein
LEIKLLYAVLKNKNKDGETKMDIILNLLSMPISMLILFALTILPIKMGADLLGAPNNAIKHCAITLLLQMAAVIFILIIAKGFSAAALMFVAVSMIYWQVLKVSFISSFAFTIFIFLIQIAMLAFIAKLPTLLM